MSETLWLAIGLFACGIGLGFIIGINIAHVYGQDIDPCGASNLDMYKKLCDEQEVYELYDQLLNRTIEWNLLHNNTATTTTTKDYCHDHFTNGSNVCHKMEMK